MYIIPTIGRIETCGKYGGLHFLLKFFVIFGHPVTKQSSLNTNAPFVVVVLYYAIGQ